jgi:hypothetical protein
MVKINPFNVAKLLFDEISSKNYESSPINSKEIELKNELLGEYYMICLYFYFESFISALALYALTSGDNIAHKRLPLNPLIPLPVSRESQRMFKSWFRDTRDKRLRP